MAIYKNLIVGCSLGVVTLLILISTQLPNTIIPTRNVTSTQEPPPDHPPMVYNQTIDTQQLTSKNFTLKGDDPDNVADQPPQNFNMLPQRIG